MLLLAVILIALPFGLAAVIGAPYLPILQRDAKGALDLANLKPGQTLIDLGSGDGRLLVAAARRGIKSIGYEINPFVYAVSLLVTWRYRQLITIHLRDFWTTPLPPADGIFVFLIDRHMARLDKKLGHEIHQPTPVVSFVFQIPGKKPRRQTKNAYLYEYGQR